MPECATEIEPLRGFRAFHPKTRVALAEAYSWRDQGLFPYFQMGRLILVKESGALAALARFRREGEPLPYFKAGAGPPPLTSHPGRLKVHRTKSYTQPQNAKTGS